MARENNDFNGSVSALLKGMEAFVSSKTVVGEAVKVNDSIILPLVDVKFGVAAGAFNSDKKNNSAGGMSAQISPSAVLVIQNGMTKLVNVKNQNTVTKILDMVPDVINQFSGKNKMKEDPEVDKAVDDIVSEREP